MDDEAILLNELNFTAPEQCQAYRDLKEVVLPGQTRTDLIEYLLTKYDAEILEDCTGNIEVALKQIGVWALPPNKTGLDQVIGFFESI